MTALTCACGHPSAVWQLGKSVWWEDPTIFPGLQQAKPTCQCCGLRYENFGFGEPCTGDSEAE